MHHVRFTFLIGCLLVCAMAGLASAQEAVHHRAASADDFQRWTRDRFVTVQSEPAGVRLARSWLIATEEGITSKRNIRLSETTQVRKVFDLPADGASGADLYIYRGGGTPQSPMVIEVNGERIEHIEAGIEEGRGWRRQPIPGELLRQGRNTLVLSGHGVIVDDRRSATVGSSISYDAGENWHPAEGELVLRLRVHGHPQQGTLTSDVIDVGRVLAPEAAIGPHARAAAARVDVDADTPADTAIALAWRSGSTPQFAPQTWTVWHDGSEAAPLDHRYFQWRMQLSTEDASRTPLVRSVDVAFTPAEPQATPDWLDRVEVTHLDRPALRESSYPYEFETDTPRIQYFRDKFELTSLFDLQQNDLDATTAIRRWVSYQWKNGWDTGYYSYVPPWDALILLEMAPDNLSLGMCTHYATTYVQTSAALGYVSRHIIVNSHTLGETFLNDRGQWALQDPGPGAGPDGFPIGVRFEKDGELLTALDMHRAFVEGEQGIEAVPDPQDGEPEALDPAGKRISLYHRFAIPLRNNHLSKPAPAEEEHGMAHYRYDGYLWWADDLDDPYHNVAYFSLLSNRADDFYPSVNTTGIELDAGGENMLSVNLWSTTPNASGYEVNIDGAGWAEVSTPVEWTLHAGENTLEARSVNVFGQAGPASSATVVVHDAAE